MDPTTHVWVVDVYWGPGSMDPMSYVDSVWSTPAAADARKEQLGPSAAVTHMRIDTPQGEVDE